MNINKDKIRRYITNKFSMNDYLLVSSYFNKEEYNEELKEILEEDWTKEKSVEESKTNLDTLLHKIHHKITLNNSPGINKLQKLKLTLLKVAAVLLIPALLSTAVLTYFSLKHVNPVESWAEIHSPMGTRTKFLLPDGTLGWLNSGTTLKYPVNFAKNRNVEVSGEAWFDVTHQQNNEFRVKTAYFDVKVLGTQFNVIAYDNEETAEVILEKGMVQLESKNNKLMGKLKPDQHFIYQKSTNSALKTNIDSKLYTSWKDGLLIFKNESMSEIAKRLSRKYNAEIVLHGDSLKSSIFRATFQDERLDEICKLLSTVAPIDYKIHKRHKQTNDTFTQNKVEFWLKE